MSIINSFNADDCILLVSLGRDPNNGSMIPQTHFTQSPLVLVALRNLTQGIMRSSSEEIILDLIRCKDPLTGADLPSADFMRDWNVRRMLLTLHERAKATKPQVVMAPECSISSEADVAPSTYNPDDLVKFAVPLASVHAPFQVPQPVVPAPATSAPPVSKRKKMRRIQKGSEEDREATYMCVAMYDEGGYNSFEIGEALDLSASAVRHRVTAATDAGYVLPPACSVPKHWRVWPPRKPSANPPKHDRRMRRYDWEILFDAYARGQSIDKIADALMRTRVAVEVVMAKASLPVTDVLKERPYLTPLAISSSIEHLMREKLKVRKVRAGKFKKSIASTNVQKRVTPSHVPPQTHH